MDDFFPVTKRNAIIWNLPRYYTGVPCVQGHTSERITSTGACEECKNSYLLKYRLSLKREAMAAYGGMCVCCDEDHLDFLAIDHVNGGGREHRKEAKKIYKWLKDNQYPQDGRFRVLCHNCNFSIGAYGVCSKPGS